MPWVDCRHHDHKLTHKLRVFDKDKNQFIEGESIVAVNTEEGWIEIAERDDQGNIKMREPGKIQYKRIVGKFELRHNDKPDEPYTAQPQKVK